MDTAKPNTGSFRRLIRNLRLKDEERKYILVVHPEQQAAAKEMYPDDCVKIVESEELLKIGQSMSTPVCDEIVRQKRVLMRKANFYPTHAYLGIDTYMSWRREMPQYLLVWINDSRDVIWNGMRICVRADVGVHVVFDGSDPL